MDDRSLTIVPTLKTIRGIGRKHLKSSTMRITALPFVLAAYRVKAQPGYGPYPADNHVVDPRDQIGKGREEIDDTLLETGVVGLPAAGIVIDEIRRVQFVHHIRPPLPPADLDPAAGDPPQFTRITFSHDHSPPAAQWVYANPSTYSGCGRAAMERIW